MFLKRVENYFFFSLQHWEVFKKVTEVFILVPALLGLKGNLEMTLASRLSTAVSSFLPLSMYIFYTCAHTHGYICVCVCLCLFVYIYISHMLFLSIEENFYEEKKFSPLSTDKFLNLRAMLSSYACYHVLKVPWAV